MSTYIKLILTAVLFIVGAVGGFAQSKADLSPETPNSDYITYQGRLTVAGVPATGNYDFQFKVLSSSGTVIQSVEAIGVPVTNGIFTARFLVGLSTFGPGLNQSMAVGVRQLPTEPYTPLLPVQPISATPLALKSHESNFAQFASNAAQLNGVNANQYVLTDDPRLNDTREPAPGSANYIQNNAGIPQTADFNVSGVGNAATFNARSSFALDGFIVLAAPGANNLFAGVNAGAANTTGADNAIFGREAGFNNATGSGNSFFGSGAGKYTTVDGNSFFGKHAGYFTSTGGFNAFFGKSAGFSNTTGGWNTLFGYEAGYSNLVGAGNVFVGFYAGRTSTSSKNTFVGYTSGQLTTSGSGNAFFGAQSGEGNTTGSDNTFLGAGAGFESTTGHDNTSVGNNTGSSTSTGIDNVFVGSGAGSQNTIGNSNVFIGARAGWGTPLGTLNDDESSNIAIGTDARIGAGVSNSVVIGDHATVTADDTIVLGSNLQNTVVSGQLRVVTIPLGGSSQLCAGFFNTISLCSSSIRFKENVDNFTGGLDLIKRLRPVSFTWKTDRSRDVGFIAEEVAAIEPLLANHDANGEVYGVKYDRISTALVNAVNAQQTQIESLQTHLVDQQKQIQKQQEEIDLLKRVVCETNAAAAVCKEKE